MATEKQIVYINSLIEKDCKWMRNTLNDYSGLGLDLSDLFGMDGYIAIDAAYNEHMPRGSTIAVSCAIVRDSTEWVKTLDLQSLDSKQASALIDELKHYGGIARMFGTRQNAVEYFKIAVMNPDTSNARHSPA